MASEVPISVVISTYNRAGLVPRAIESVLKQSRPADEIIVVDDGSQDDTVAALERFRGKIRLISRPNTGISGARNSGIEAAQYPWIAFLDDDDVYEPERLLIAESAIRRFPQVAVHASNIAVITPGAAEISLFEMRGRSVSALQLLQRPLEWAFGGCFFVQATVCLRAALLEVGGFRKMFYEDLDLLVKLALRGPWTVSGACSLRLIREAGDSSNLSALWRSRPVDNYQALVGIYEHALSHPGLDEKERRTARAGLAGNLYQLGRAQRLAGAWSEARRSFLRGAKFAPSMLGSVKMLCALGLGQRFDTLLERIRPRKSRLERSAVPSGVGKS